MRHKDYSIADRVVSVLSSLVFPVPTCLLLWFGLSKQFGLFGSGDVLPVSMLWGVVSASCVTAFILPSVFPSLLEFVWKSILKIQKWWGW